MNYQLSDLSGGGCYVRTADKYKSVVWGPLPCL